MKKTTVLTCKICEHDIFANQMKAHSRICMQKEQLQTKLNQINQEIKEIIDKNYLKYCLLNPKPSSDQFKFKVNSGLSNFYSKTEYKKSAEPIANSTSVSSLLRKVEENVPKLSIYANEKNFENKSSPDKIVKASNNSFGSPLNFSKAKPQMGFSTYSEFINHRSKVIEKVKSIPPTPRNAANSNASEISDPVFATNFCSFIFVEETESVSSIETFGFIQEASVVSQNLENSESVENVKDIMERKNTFDSTENHDSTSILGKKELVTPKNITEKNKNKTSENKNSIVSSELKIDNDNSNTDDFCVGDMFDMDGMAEPSKTFDENSNTMFPLNFTKTNPFFKFPVKSGISPKEDKFSSPYTSSSSTNKPHLRKCATNYVPRKTSNPSTVDPISSLLTQLEKLANKS